MALKIKIQWFNIKVLNHQIVKLNQLGSRSGTISQARWIAIARSWGSPSCHDQGEGYETTTVHDVPDVPIFKIFLNNSVTLKYVDKRI